MNISKNQKDQQWWWLHDEEGITKCHWFYISFKVQSEVETKVCGNKVKVQWPVPAGPVARWRVT